MKTCTKCKREDPDCGFHKAKTTRDGLRPECKECRNAAESARLKAKGGKKYDPVKARAYYLANREARLKQQVEIRKSRKDQNNA